MADGGIRIEGKVRSGDAMKEITRQEVRALLDRGAQLVEALPAKEFAEDHLPEAINLPLRKIETDARKVLEPARPIVVYCWDSA